MDKKIAIRTPTKEIFASTVTTLYTLYNKSWSLPQDFETVSYGDQTCINFEEDFLHYCNSAYYERRDYEILSLEDFLLRVYKEEHISGRRIKLRK